MFRVTVFGQCFSGVWGVFDCCNSHCVWAVFQRVWGVLDCCNSHCVLGSVSVVFGVCLIVVTATVFGQYFSGVWGVFDCCNSHCVWAVFQWCLWCV